MSLLRVEGLRVRLAEYVLLGIDLELERGETLGLVGESGSGKSMTALAIMGLLPPGARAVGRVLFEGRDLLAQDEAAWCRFRGAAAGMVFQEPMTALDPLMRVGRQVAEPLRAHRRMGRRAARAEAAALLERVGVHDAYPHRLSGGQRQRAMIAAALACGPALLIADEPTSALDVLVQAHVLALLEALRAERGLAMLLVSHDLQVIARTTARVAVMYAGRIVEQGATQTVFGRLAHPYTRALHAASPHAAVGLPVPLPGRMPAPGALPPGCAFAPRCVRVQDDCTRTVPALRGAPEHLVACLHPHQ